MADPPTTDNHDLPLIPPIGETDAEDYADQWGQILNDEAWSELDELLIARDIESNRSEYTAYEDAIFWATDTGGVFTGTGTEWAQQDAEFGDVVASTLTLAGDLSTDDGTTLWDSTASEIPIDRLATSDLTVASNTVSLGGSISIDHADLSTIGADDHHEAFEPVDYTPVSDVDAEVTDASTSVSGLDTAVSENVSDIDALETEVSTLEYVDLDDTGTAFPIPNTDLSNDSVTVAGNTVALGNSTNIAHADLTSISDDDHHVRYADSEAVGAIETTDLSGPISFEDTTNEKLNLYSDRYGLGVSSRELTIYSGGDVRFRYDEYDGTSRVEFNLSNGDAEFDGDISAANDSITVAGNEISFGGSSAINHDDLSSIGADDHHIAHEHPGDRTAESTLTLNSNDIVGVKELSGEYASHHFEGSTYNIDLLDSTVDARFRDTNDDTIAWFRDGGDVEIPNGNVELDTGTISGILTARIESTDRGRIWWNDGTTDRIQLRFNAGSGTNNEGLFESYSYDANGDYIGSLFQYDLGNEDFQFDTNRVTINSDLRLDTGEAIEDGDGNRRFDILSDRTEVFAPGEDFDNQLTLRSDSESRIRTSEGFYLFDRNGVFRALEYETSSSAPGTLELTNAELDLNGNDISGVDSLSANTLSQSTAVASGETLTVSSDEGTAVSGGVTVDGELVVDGSFTDTSGTISGDGKISGTGKVKAFGSAENE